MTISWRGTLVRHVLSALVVLFLLPGPATADEAGTFHLRRADRPSGKQVRLSMRIAQAKKMEGRRRYYQSLARRQRALSSRREGTRVRKRTE